MDCINSYAKARKFFDEEFAPERERVIQLLENLKQTIQNKTINQKQGSMAYSAAGVLSGGAMLVSLLAAPMTGGMSTLMTFGFYGGMVSGVADVSHRYNKWTTIKKLVGNAVTILKAHEITFSDLKQKFLLKLMEDIDTIKRRIEIIRQIKCDEEKEIKACLKFFKAVGKLDHVPKDSKKFLNSLAAEDEFIIDLLVSDGLICRGISIGAKLLARNGAWQLAEDVVKESAKDCAQKGARNGVKQVAKRGLKVGTKDLAKKGAKDCARQAAKGGAKDFVKAFSVASVGLALVLDLNSFFSSCEDVSSLRKGNLCDEAENLDSVIKKMKYELKYLDRWFEERVREETKLLNQNDD